MIVVMKMTKKQTNTVAFQSKYTPFRHYYLVKKDQNNRAGVNPPPPPPKRAMPV